MTIQLISNIRPPVSRDVTCEVDKLQPLLWLGRTTGFTERALWEVNCAWVDTKPREIKATGIISGDRGGPTGHTISNSIILPW